MAKSKILFLSATFWTLYLQFFVFVSICKLNGIQYSEYIFTKREKINQLTSETKNPSKLNTTKKQMKIKNMKIRVQKGNKFQRQVFSLLSADI